MSTKPSLRVPVRLTSAVECAGCAAKLGPADLRAALKKVPRGKRDPRVLVDSSTLDDAGVFAFGKGTALVQTVDFFTPILDKPFDFGRAAAANALSDVYAMGGKPLTALGIVGFPDELLPLDTLGEILRGGASIMREAGVAVLGGHSVRDKELKFGYSVTGVVDPKRMLTNAGARVGDRLILTKRLGTGILSTALKRGLLTPGGVKVLTKSMTTLNRAASECAIEFGVHAATDVTGFSLLGHSSQMADASKVSFRIRPDASWLLPGAQEFAAQGVIPGGLARNRDFYASKVRGNAADAAIHAALYDPQTSGGLLLSVPAKRAVGLLLALRAMKLPAIAVGEVVRRGKKAVEIVAS